MSGTNENPGWVFGYVPSPGEWNAEFASKVDAFGGFATGLTAAGVIAQGTWTLTGATFSGGTFSGGTLSNVTLSGVLSGGTLSAATLIGDTTNAGVLVGGTISGAAINGGQVAPTTFVVGGGTAATIVGLDGSAHPEGLLIGSGLAVVNRALVSTVTSPLVYEGLWNAATNTPSLSSGGGGGTAGEFFQILPGGSTSIDGISAWVAGAFIQNVGGTVWIQANFTSIFGSMAYQNANSVDVTGGTVDGLSLFGIGSGYSVAPVNPLLPIFGDVQVGSDGVSVCGYLTGATRYIQNLTSDVATLASATAGTLDVSTLNTAGLVVQAGNVLSGVQVSFLDSTGSDAWLTYDYDGVVSVPALKVGGALIVPASAASGVPSYAVDVTQYGAKGYSRRGHFYATYSQGGVTLSLAKFVGSVTATAASTAFAITGVTDSGIAFQPGYDEGLPIWIEGGGVGGADLVTTIAQVVDGQNVVLTDAIQTVPSGSSVGVVWPCFTGSDLGALIWVDCAQQPVYVVAFTTAETTTQVGVVSNSNTIVVASATGILVNQTVIDNTNTAAIPGSQFPGQGQGTQVATISGATLTLTGTVTSSNGDSLSFGTVGLPATDTTAPNGTQPLMAFIDSINSPVQVGISLSPKAGITAFPIASAGLVTEVAWGIDDLAAFAAAADAAQIAGAKIVYAPGTSKTYLTASLFDTSSFSRQWIGATPDQATVYYTVWAGDNRAGGHHVDVSGRKLWNKQVPIYAGGIPPSPRTANLRKQAPGLAGKTTLTVTIIGASLGETDPQGQFPLWFDSDMFIEKMISDNPGTTFTFVNYSVGGTSIADFDNGLVGNSSNYYWYTNPTQPIFEYLLNQSPAPDLIYIPAAGANDSWSFHPQHWRSMIARIRAAFPSVYIMWQIIGNKGHGSYLLPGIEPEILTYANGYVRGACTQLNIPFVDPDPLATRVHYGWDPLRMRERYIPSFSGAVSSSVPWSVSMLVRDYSAVWTLGNGISGSAAWTALGQLKFPLSPRTDNWFILDIDGSGNLRYTVQDWGATVTTPCALANGSHTLTTSGQSTFTGNIRWRANHKDIEAGSPSGPFSSGNIGECVIFPAADANAMPMRTFIQRVAASYSAFTYDYNGLNASISTVGGALVYGGMMFVPMDATGQADCVIGPDGSGNILVTKITGYTSANQVTLRDPWPHASLSPGSPVPVFVGLRSVQPTSTAIPAGTDGGVGAQVEVSVKGRRLLCRYWVGGATYQVPPIALDTIVPRLGGEFPLAVWCSGSGTTLSAADMWRDEDDYSWRSEVFYDLSGSVDADADGRYGGSGPHPSSVSAEMTTRPALEANDLAY